MRKSHGKNSRRSRNLKSKGRLAITQQLREFDIGDSVRINVNPRFKRGMPHLRFNHRNGKITARCGEGYQVLFSDINKGKVLFVANVHLEKV